MTSPLRIRMARRYAALSQAQLALKVGVQRSAVSHWEAPGCHDPSVAHLRLIAEVTNVQFEWLVTGRGAMMLATGTMVDSVISTHAVPVNDALEVRLIDAFREAPARTRIALVDLVEQIAAARCGRKKLKAE